METNNSTSYSKTTGASYSENTGASWEVKVDKNKHKYVVGIDLGHGETSAAYAEIGWDLEAGLLDNVKDIDLANDKTYVIPSAIAICPNGDVYVGADAFEHTDANLHVCFKQKPVDINGSAEQLMVKFMKAVYALIREKVGAILTDSNHVVYIATPSGWDKQTQDLYGQMAAQAGLPIAGVTWESRAAFIKAQSSADSGLPQFVDNGAIVFDMGSSTLDFTYISSEVLNANKKPIDFGYDCGASKVEKLMYQRLREDNEEVTEFEQKYPKATDRLLFEMRKGKEEYYRKADHKLRKTVDFYQLVNDEDLNIIRCSYAQGELDDFLRDKGYIGKIKDAMLDFANNHISGKPVLAAFFTGGASRMDFLVELVKDVWHCEYIFRDQNPSLTISQGVAEVARSDIRSGGTSNIKGQLNKIMSEIDVYESFAGKLSDKIFDEITDSIAGPVNSFRDSDEDMSLYDLQTSITNWIEQDVANIGSWSKECMADAFEEATKEIREEVSKKMANYSKADIRMRKLTPEEIKMPEMDLSIINQQVSELATTFTEEASGWGTIFTGAAVGFVAALVFTGPIGWIAGGLYTVWKTWMGANETEEEKKEKAMHKDLNKEERQKVHDEFANKWDEICQKVCNTINNALNNSNLKNRVNSQCNGILRSYAEECLRQTRLMLD